MNDATLDPYAVLGVDPGVSDIELRRVYRELVKRHHPDHNGGSPESTRRFAQIQNAYAAIAQGRRSPQSVPDYEEPIGAHYQAPDPNLEDRIQRLEEELARMREAEEHQAREQARQAAQRAAGQQAAARAAAQRAAEPQRPDGWAAQTSTRRPTQEELGYYTTDDSFTKIIDDASEQVAERLLGGDAKRQFARRLSDLFGRGDSDSRGGR